MSPTISVIIAMRNAEATIADTLASLQAQTFADWEAIVIDDASTDASAEFVERLAQDEPRLRLIRVAEQRGPSGARNAALDAAAGRFLGFLDADDLLLPDALERLLGAATANPGACAFGGVEYRGPQGEDLAWRVAPAKEQLRLDDLLGDARLTIMTLTPRETLGEHRFDESLTICEDMDLWLRLALDGARFVAAPEIVYAYRLRPGSLTRRFAHMREQHERVMRRAFARASALGWASAGVDCSDDRLARSLLREATLLASMAACTGGADDGAAILEPAWHGASIEPLDAVDLGLWACAYAHCRSRHDWADLPDGWLEALAAWWRRCEGAGRAAPGFTDACAALVPERIVTNERVADAIVDDLAGDARVTLLGFGANARLLADRLLARGVQIDARDDRIDAGAMRDLPAGVTAAPMAATLPTRFPLVITTMQDEWLVRRLGARAERATRWAEARRRLIESLRPAVRERMHPHASCAA